MGIEYEELFVLDVMLWWSWPGSILSHFWFAVVVSPLLVKLMYRNSARQNIFGLFQYYGIPQHYGLFYAMGAALMMEGVLSGCYHVCPNHSNFQFGKFIISHFSVTCLMTG
jgi:hypothetical protein